MSHDSFDLIRRYLWLPGCWPIQRPVRRALVLVAVGWWLGACTAWAGDQKAFQRELVEAIERSLTLLEASSAGSAEERTCFTCHSQAHPVLTIVEARRRGFRIGQENLNRQIHHTAKHLTRGRKDYLGGRGQGGRSDTAGYALWTLHAGEFHDRETTEPVAGWLLNQQHKAGHWKRSGDRPPSEASDFTTTYVALRGVAEFAAQEHRSRVDETIKLAREWLTGAVATDTEDRVFRLLALRLVAAPEEAVAEAIRQLLDTQRCDGGWGQTDAMDSDAYATGTALFALQQTGGLAASDPAYENGLRYLLSTQQDDGSWHVSSRSRPFQVHYETGFPHGKDQFISTSATAWGTLAMLLAIPSKPAARE